MNQQTRWVAERAVIITIACPRCGSGQQHQLLKEVECAWNERTPVLGVSDVVLRLHCRECSI